MKKARKGFTLVELLIVVAILATLTAAMTASISGSTAKAKAATIASNVNACVEAAHMYCTAHMDDGTDISTITTDVALGEYIGKWLDMKATDASVLYTGLEREKDAASKAVTGAKRWYIKVEIKDSDADNIVAELEKIPGFGKYGESTSVVSGKTFYVTLWDGKVTATEPKSS